MASEPQSSACAAGTDRPRASANPTVGGVILTWNRPTRRPQAAARSPFDTDPMDPTSLQPFAGPPTGTRGTAHPIPMRRGAFHGSIFLSCDLNHSFVVFGGRPTGAGHLHTPTTLIEIPPPPVVSSAGETGPGR